MRTIEEISNVFFDRFNDLMKENNLTISALARKTGIPRTTLNNYALKKVFPKIESLDCLAEFFKVTIDYLVGREN